MQEKITLDLAAMDRECALRIMNVWKTMISTTLRNKGKIFRNLEDYLKFRILDVGAPYVWFHLLDWIYLSLTSSFVEAVMLFGLGMTLTPEEDEKLEDVVYNFYAALGLANDYFSFEREYDEFQHSDATTLTNAVWLYMNWQNVGVETAKNMVREATMTYEKNFLSLCQRFKASQPPVSSKINEYLTSLQHLLSGNVVWSISCPRYHSKSYHDIDPRTEDVLTQRYRGGRPEDVVCSL